MYHELSKETGEFFDFMVEHELFDLETKPGKQTGGYCTFLNTFKAPFIFSNFNGTSADVDVLTHEAAMHSRRIQAAKQIPFMGNVFPDKRGGGDSLDDNGAFRIPLDECILWRESR